MPRWEVVSLLLVFTFVLAAGMGTAGATDGWSNARCLNSTHLFQWDVIYTTLTTHRANSTTDCSPGLCDNNTASCVNRYEVTTIQASMFIPLYIILFVAAVGSLWFGWRGKHIIGTMFSTIVFFTLGLQSVALDAFFAGTFFSGMTSIFIMLFWFLGICSFAMTLLGLYYYVDQTTKAKKRERIRQGFYG